MIHEPGSVPFTYWTLDNNRIEAVAGGIVEETRLSIYVNVQEVATVMCSPLEQEALALGFLFNEGIINSMDEVGLIRANATRTTVDILLTRSDFSPPRRMVLTSGCGGGVSFQDLQRTHPALQTDFRTEPSVIFDLMRSMKGAARLYNKVRGVHTCIMGDKHGMLLSAEDVGRHNTIDKIAGKALMQQISTGDRILVTSGRISSEMLNKARVLGTPIVVSHTSPTSLTVGLADAWNICVVGYVRQQSMRVYTHPERLGLENVSIQMNRHQVVSTP
jgi:FdhD protein